MTTLLGIEVPDVVPAIRRNREDWLSELVEAFRPEFTDRGVPFRNIQVSVGWPIGTRKAIGQCFGADASNDDANHIFVSPALDKEDVWEVVGTVAHELVHASVGCEHGHKAPFKRAGLAIGLDGKPTQMGAGPDFRAWAAPIVNTHGEYPHSALRRPGAKQGTRLLKVQCPNKGHADYIVRMTRKAIEFGLPTCPCGCGMVEADTLGA